MLLLYLLWTSTDGKVRTQCGPLTIGPQSSGKMQLRCSLRADVELTIWYFFTKKHNNKDNLYMYNYI
jgi:hypothetical protein